MKKTIASFVALLSFCAFPCGGAFAADGAVLFNAADFISKTKESTLLDDKGKAQLAFWRTRPELKNPTVVALDTAAFESSIVNLTSPEGTTFQYVGAKVVQPDGISVWRGKSKTGTLTVSFTADSLSGEFSEGRKLYHLWTLPGKKAHVIAEAVRLGFEEPTEEEVAQERKKVIDDMARRQIVPTQGRTK